MWFSAFEKVKLRFLLEQKKKINLVCYKFYINSLKSVKIIIIEEVWAYYILICPACCMSELR